MSSAGQVLNNWDFGYGSPYGGEVRVDPSGIAWVTMNFDESFIVKVTSDRSSWSTTRTPRRATTCWARRPTAACGARAGASAQDTVTEAGADAAGGTMYPLPSDASYPNGLAAGPAGSIWFTRSWSGTFATSPSHGSVGYLDATSGATTIWSTGFALRRPRDLVQGPDGQMWFTNAGAVPGHRAHSATGWVGAISSVGSYEPTSLTFGTDGFIYATDAANNVIIKVSRDQLQTTNVDPGAGSVLVGGAAGAAGLGKVKLGKKPVAVRNNAVALRLACPKEVAQGCVGKARLTTNAKKKPKAVSRSVGYQVKAGKKGQLKLKLTAKGLKALKKGKVTKLRLELYAKGATAPAVVQVVKVAPLGA